MPLPPRPCRLPPRRRRRNRSVAARTPIRIGGKSAGWVEIAKAHGGCVALDDREGGGLSVMPFAAG